jgi:hypothetical protein
MILVGLVGTAGSGKTTFAIRLRERHGFTLASFADPLKVLCSSQFGWDRQALDFDWAANRHGFRSALDYKEAIDPNVGKTRREILQHIGTEGFRAIDPDHWVKKAVASLWAGRHHVFADVRFPNEAAAIKKKGGVLVRLVRKAGSPRKAGITHPSETEIERVRPDFVYSCEEGVDQVELAADEFIQRDIKDFGVFVRPMGVE